MLLPNSPTMPTEPFFMVPKSAQARIISRVEGSNAVYCLAVYVSCRRLANDAGRSAGPVELTINLIALHAGCSYRKAADALQLLRHEGLITIEARRIPGTSGQLPSVYSFGTLDQTSGTMDRTLGTEPDPLSAEINKEHKELKESWAQSPLATVPKARQAVQRPSRPQNLLLETLAELDGSRVSEVTRVAWKGINRALSEIKAVSPNVTPEEIRRRAGHYQRHFPDAAISCHALSKHWARCQSSPRPRNGDTRREANVKQIDLTQIPAAAS